MLRHKLCTANVSNLCSYDRSTLSAFVGFDQAHDIGPKPVTSVPRVEDIGPKPVTSVPRVEDIGPKPVTSVPRVEDIVKQM